MNAYSFAKKLHNRRRVTTRPSAEDFPSSWGTIKNRLTENDDVYDRFLKLYDMSRILDRFTEQNLNLQCLKGLFNHLKTK